MDKKFHTLKLGNATMYLDKKDALIAILAFGGELILKTPFKKEQEDLFTQLKEEKIDFTISQKG